MVNVKDFAIKLNDTIIIPIERKTSLGVVLEYEYNNECVVYPMSKWEETHTNEKRVIDYITFDVAYNFKRNTELRTNK